MDNFNHNNMVPFFGAKITGKSINEQALSTFTEEMRQCEKTHSSELSEVFFITLDEIDCIRDPFSFLK